MRAVNLASDGAHIYLDGDNTDKDPYTCDSTSTLSYPGIYVNKSLSFVRFGATPQIRCFNGTNVIFEGSNNDFEVNVVLSGLIFNDTIITFRDSSAIMDGCEFKGRKQSINFTITNKNFTSIQVRNSLFSKNATGLSVVVDTRKKGSLTNLVLEIKNATFKDNFDTDTGKLIDIQSSHSVSCDLTLDNVTFSNNMVSRMGLVYISLAKGHQNLLLKNTVVTGNNHLCPFGDCSELCITSNSASVLVGGANFLGLSGRAISITATNLSAQVYNSSFKGYGVNGDGGAVFLLASDNANITVINSSFTSTAAFGGSRGGAIYLQSPNSKFTLRRCVFKHNNAGGGGAISVSTFRYLTNLENVTRQEDRSISYWNAEAFLTVDITDCIFKSTSSYSGGGAVSIIAPKMSVRLHNSTFFGCSSFGDGGALFVESLSQIAEVIVYVEQSHFTECRSNRGRGGAVFVTSLRLANVTLKSSRFRLSSAVGYGGVLAILTPDSSLNKNFEVVSENYITIEGSCFVNSISSGAPGEVIFIDGLAKQNTTVKRSTFTNNTAMGPGGAISVMTLGQSNPLAGSQKFIKIESSLFFNNTGHAPGGAIYIDSGVAEYNPTRRRAYFMKNTSGSPGEAIFSAIPARKNSQVQAGNYITIDDCSFVQNTALAPGGAISITGGQANQNIKIKSTYFTDNNSTARGGAISLDNEIPGHLLTINDTSFSENAALGPGGGAYFSLRFRKVTMSNVTFRNCRSGSIGGAIALQLSNKSSNKSVVVINSSLFQNNFSPKFPGGALYTDMPWDTLKDAGCINKRAPLGDPDIRLTVKEGKFPEWDYNSKLSFKDTTFKYNTALLGGALYLSRGKTTFQNCSFVDNFASVNGGAIYAEEGSTSLVLSDSSFLQSKNELTRNLQTFSKSSFIHTESTGPLVVENTTMNAVRNNGGHSIVTIGKGGLVDFGDDNSTQLYCSVGSKMQFLNFSNTITTRTNDSLCTVRVTGLDYSCLPCASGLYSLQRGQVHGTHLESGFKCLICPFGANCSQNIAAKQNFWGFKEGESPPSLKFVMCPMGCCGGLNESLDSLDYNSCLGNRSGILCGRCKQAYTETLYSTHCRPIPECTDYWFWPVAVLYVLFLALYVTFQPPFLSWMKRQIVWFRGSEPATQEPEYDKGYLKIGFYFYQAGNLLLVSSSKSRVKTYFVDFVVGLFNFQQNFSSVSGFICPFAGFTIVTKKLFSTVYVLATLFMIGLIYSFHLGFQMIRGRDAPFAGPYLGGILQILLLGYTILGSVSFDLLRCVPIGSQRRLFYDGNMVCYEWWQYILIAFIVTFIAPFGFVLFWGALKLHRQAISVKRLLLACIFPAPFLIQWIFTALLGSCGDGTTSSSQLLIASIGKVLYDPFKIPEDGRAGSLHWESVLIGRRLVLIVMKAVISDPLPRLMVMTFFSCLVLLHHFAKQPFRDSFANRVETISLLSLVLLGMVNLFPASFVSLAVSSTGPFTDWLNVCLWVELLLLGFVPVLFLLVVIVFIISQVCRLLFVVSCFLFHFCGICRSVGCCMLGRSEAELLPPET